MQTVLIAAQDTLQENTRKVRIDFYRFQYSSEQ